MTVKQPTKVDASPNDGQENIQKKFRLHVGGLGPTVVPQDLERRFSSFGSVLKVDGVGKLDANGCPLHYGFVDILSTDLQIKRCMNLLSGTTYKGSTLRIAPSKPDYIARAEREKANLPIHTFIDPDEAMLREREEKATLKRERKLARIRARRRGIEGYQSTNMELMTVQRFKSRQGVNGWKKDPETSLPIFPIIARPLRPLPSLDLTQSQANVSKEESQVVRVPNRARRIRIDPTLYRAAIKHRKTHIVGPRAISIEQYKLGFISGAKNLKKSQLTRPMWNCYPSDDGRIIWRLQNGEGSQEEQVQLSNYTIRELRGAAESCMCLKPDPICNPDVSESVKSTASITEANHAPSKIESTSALCSEALPVLSSTSPLRLRGGSSVKQKAHRDKTSDVQLSNLTDMFKAKEDEKKGFSLNDALDGMELDENLLAAHDGSESEVRPSSAGLALEKTQEAKQSKSKAFIHPSRLTGSSLLGPQQVAASMKPSKRKGPFFFYPTHEDADSRVIDSLISSERRESVRQTWLSDDVSSSSDGWRSFLTTESISQIESAHNEKKSQLTEHMRRKHKDALKQERKRGTRLIEL